MADIKKDEARKTEIDTGELGNEKEIDLDSGKAQKASGEEGNEEENVEENNDDQVDYGDDTFTQGDAFRSGPDGTSGGSANPRA